MSETRKELLGHVGVDSGQLMITDPCYIESQWQKEGDSLAIDFWGQGGKDAYDHFSQYYEVEDVGSKYRIKCVDEFAQLDIQQEIRDFAQKIGKTIVAFPSSDSTYDKIGDLTCGSELQGGPIPYKMGHEGFAVAFSSGFGDGVYEVWAEYKDFGKWGERITRVEVILIDEDEYEDEYFEEE